MPQNDYIERHIKQHGRRLDYEERKRKREAREVHKVAEKAQKLTGWKGKQFAKKRYAEKVAMRKKIKAHEQSKAKGSSKPLADNGEALPTYLLDREQTNTARPSLLPLNRRGWRRQTSFLFLSLRFVVSVKKRCSRL